MATSTADMPIAGGNRAIGLICAGHFFSHFYMLLLPPLFPVLTGVYDVGFTELGFAITAYSLATGVLQAPVGFLVDRYGARLLLVAALLLEAVAFTLIGLLQSYTALIVLMMVAGVANSVFHPADYAILNASVSPRRMGRAFSLHSFSAHVGNAAGPLVVLGLLGFMGVGPALAVCGIGGIVVALVIAANSAVLLDATATPAAPKSGDGGRGAGGWALLFSAPILLGMLFYAGTSMFNRGVTGFGVATVNLLHDIPLTEAGVVLSGYLLVSPLGVLFGGWLADRTHRHALVAAVAFSLIAAAAAALAGLPAGVAGATALFAVIGFCAGALMPSRDMLIRSVTPPGEMGKVFGFVSTGLNVAGVIAPPLYGYLLDRGEPAVVFWLVAGIALASIATVTATGSHARRGVPPVASPG